VREPLGARIRELEAATGGAGVDEAGARARKRMAEAELAELRLAELRGELLDREAVVATWSTHIYAARNRLRAIPKRAVVQLGLTRQQGLALLALVDEMLKPLADGDGTPRPRGRRARRREGAAA